MHWKSPSDINMSMMKLPSGSFSWSIRRRNLFAFCKRAYFYHYYGATGGWDPYAPEEQRRIYLLKNLRKAEDWAIELFSENIRSIIEHKLPNRKFNQAEAAQILNRKIHQQLHRGCIDILSENWRQDLKAVNLFEIYYGTMPDKEEKVTAYVRQRVAQLSANFIRHPLFNTIGEIDRIQLKNYPLPVNFMMGSLEIWLSPTLIWQDEDRLKVLVVRGGEPPDKNELHTITGLFRLMAEQLYRQSRDKISVVFYYAGPVNKSPGVLHADTPADCNTVINTISQSSSAMLEKIMPGNFVREKDFPGWMAAQDTICTGCRFKEICRS